jgi:hypothetical protein
MLQANDTNTLTTFAIRLLVSIEMSLTNGRLVMSPEGRTMDGFRRLPLGRRQWMGQNQAVGVMQGEGFFVYLHL